MATLRITLRAGERIFVNGAVMRVDRKTHLEFMNDVTFLLESHVMQAEDATTPLRQLYFIIQLMLIDPAGAAEARTMFDRTYPGLLAAFTSAEIRSGIQDVVDLVHRERNFEGLKRLRSLLPMEEVVLAGEWTFPTDIKTPARPAVAAGAR
ncbi:flagellar biosynthesis repressor FlbT [Aureimonas sp. SK2]|uniref:flagellar biosynthesis repressor FlbT n=1 Tax=Aureimonas sp. SK2 TaxID=3015992 RepID=UPI002443D5AB|nr:flagellar biosynthesis repressor FlbT [Aureimonas sp. SK2]